MTSAEFFGTIRKYTVNYGPWVLRAIIGFIVSVLQIIKNALRDAFREIIGA